MAWAPPAPGNALPLPVLRDDADQFPGWVVREVREWLLSSAAYFNWKVVPSAQTIDASACKTLQRPKFPNTDFFCDSANLCRVYYTGEPWIVIGAWRWQHGTCEVFLPIKPGARLSAGFNARYEFVRARAEDGRSVVGPMIRQKQTGGI